MNGFARGFGTVVVSTIALLAALAFIGWGVTQYLDDNFGDGVSAIIFAVLIGIGMTILIYTLSGFQLNQTHRAAGEDITDFAANMSRTQTEQFRVQREWARQDRELAAGSMKASLVDKKSATQRADYEWRQQQRAIAEAERQRQAEAAEAAEWSWIDEGADTDAPLTYR